MNYEIVIREYQSDDELEWLDLHASVMVDSYAWWTVIHQKPTYKKETVDLVAIQENKIIGFITAEINTDEFPPGKHEAFVWEFGVHRNFRGKNIGRMMIEQLHKIINKEFGINKSVWYSQDPNSIRYYDHIGMKEIGRHWQLSLNPTKEQKESFRKDNFYCWSLRGACDIDKLDELKEKFNLVEDDDALKPMVCVGYEYIL